ncbi:MAG: YdcF family protein, partial [Planctomyces sp.]
VQERAINRKSLLPRDVFRKDAVVRSDLAIVIGTPDAENLRQRISEGISLFSSGKVAKLLLTGDGRKKHPSQRSEADRMREAAVAAGVPVSAILIEDKGQDPESSAKECARLFKSDPSLSGVHSVILVSSAWHLLRTSLVMRHHLPNRVSLLCQPAAEGITADNWQMSPQGRAIVENEIRLIEKLLKTGYSLR